VPVELDNGEEGVDCIVNLSAGSGCDLVVSQGVKSFCILGDAGNK
jgi:hypothetical protein